MEQLINAFMKLTSKAGAGDLIRDLIRAVDADGNPKTWTPREVSEAITFLNQQIERFGKSDALNIVYTLMRKYGISADELKVNEHVDETPGVKGLQ